LKPAILALWLAGACLEPGDVIDRIAVTVDQYVITLSDVLEEIRIAALLDGVEARFSAQAKREAAERIIERHLLTRDMQLTQFPLPGDAEVEDFIARVRQARKLDEDAWQKELSRYGIGAKQLHAALKQRLGVLRYVEFRFRAERQGDEAADQVNRLVDAWLKEARQRVRISWREEAFQ